MDKLKNIAMVLVLTIAVLALLTPAAAWSLYSSAMWIVLVIILASVAMMIYSNSRENED